MAVYRLQESMRLMRIKEVKSDYYDLTMSVPIGLLDGMNGDFDGDTLSLIFVFDKRLIEAWKWIHSPIDHFISRHSGEYNELSGFIKDSCVILSELWEVGKSTTYWNEWADEKDRNEYLSKLE